MVAAHIIISASPDTSVPTNRRSRKISATRYTATTTSAPVVQNSYMFPQGTRCAATPRIITAAACTSAPISITITAMRAAGRLWPVYSIDESATWPSSARAAAPRYPAPRSPVPVSAPPVRSTRVAFALILTDDFAAVFPPVFSALATGLAAPAVTGSAACSSSNSASRGAAAPSRRRVTREFFTTSQVNATNTTV